MRATRLVIDNRIYGPVARDAERPVKVMPTSALRHELETATGSRKEAIRKELDERTSSNVSFGRGSQMGDAESNAGEALHLFKKLGEISQRAEAAGTPGLEMARRTSKCLPGYYTDKDKFVGEAKAIIDDWYSAGSQGTEDRRDFERSLPEEERKFLEKYKHVEPPKEPARDAPGALEEKRRANQEAFAAVRFRNKLKNAGEAQEGFDPPYPEVWNKQLEAKRAREGRS